MMAFKNERGKCMDALGQLIGHSGVKTGKGIYYVRVFIQHHHSKTHVLIQTYTNSIFYTT